MAERRSNETAANAKPQAGGFNYIPEEIVLSVLPNLPGKSLVRFRCVSKTWSRWISKTKPRQGKKIIVRSSRNERNVLFRSIDEKLQVKDIDSSLDRLNPRESSIEASCDGLLLVNVDDDLYLWNPTIHSCRKVLSLHDSEGNYDYPFVYGLCFDSNNNDYKVVCKAREGYVKVGSCRNNSWQVISSPDKMSSVRLTGVVLNNYLHWHTSEDYGYIFRSHDNIISFDPKMNSFSEVPMPDPKEENGDMILGLGVLDGCLCMTRKEDRVTTEVLVLKEYGGKDSWQTLFKIETFETLYKTAGLRRWPYVIPLFYAANKDEVLIRIENDIMTYNLHTGEEVVNFEGEGYVCEDSLVDPTEYLPDQEGGHTNEQKVIVSVARPNLFRSINQIGEEKDINITGDYKSTDPDAFPCIYGSCNGLLIIRVRTDLFLWNPVFHCVNARLSYDRLRQYPPGKVVSGLCFNSDTNDYKVVLVLNNHDWRDRWVVVGSFRTRRWSVINNFEYCSRNLKSGPTLNCHLHFWSSNADSTDQIICFDPRIDKFTKIQLPDLPSRYRKSCIRGVGDLDGCLCLVHNDSFHSNKVYLMKQHGVKESWTCMFQFNYKNCSRVTPLFFCDEEKREVLIHATMSDGSAAIVSYNIGNEVCTEIVVLSGEGPCDGPFVYEETFARPISLKKAGTTTNIQNREEVYYRLRQSWHVEDYSQSMSIKFEFQEGEKDKKAAVVVSSGHQIPRMSNAFSLLEDSEE